MVLVTLSIHVCIRTKYSSTSIISYNYGEKLVYFIRLNLILPVFQQDRSAESLVLKKFISAISEIPLIEYSQTSKIFSFNRSFFDIIILGVKETVQCPVIFNTVNC